jgi:hypothetical protein
MCSADQLTDQLDLQPYSLALYGVDAPLVGDMGASPAGLTGGYVLDGQRVDVHIWMRRLVCPALTPIVYEELYMRIPRARVARVELVIKEAQSRNTIAEHLRIIQRGIVLFRLADEQKPTGRPQRFPTREILLSDMEKSRQVVLLHHEAVTPESISNYMQEATEQSCDKKTLCTALDRFGVDFNDWAAGKNIAEN